MMGRQMYSISNMARMVWITETKWWVMYEVRS